MDGASVHDPFVFVGSLAESVCIIYHSCLEI